MIVLVSKPISFENNIYTKNKNIYVRAQRDNNDVAKTCKREMKMGLGRFRGIGCAINTQEAENENETR